MNPASIVANSQAGETRAPAEKAGEPSMEEILASIRRIIADEQAAAPAPATATVQPIRPDIRAVPPAPQQVAPSGTEFDQWLAETASTQKAPAQRIVPVPETRPQSPPAPVRVYLQQEPAPPVPAPVRYEAEAPRFEPPAVQAPAVPQHFQAHVPYYEPALHEPHTYQQAEAAFVQSAQQQEDAPAQSVLSYYAPADHLPLDPTQPPRLTVVPPAAASQQAHEFGSMDELEVPLRPGIEPEGLMSTMAGSSVQSSFQALARTMFMQNTGLVDGAVREMLQPMLKQWLDDNLPVIVERLVRAEIERVARGGR